MSDLDGIEQSMAELVSEINDRLRAERDAALARVSDLENALAYYGERRNYRTPAGSQACKQHLGNTCGMEHADSFDGAGPGARARAALASGSPSGVDG